jgi:hypothetical protein
MSIGSYQIPAKFIYGRLNALAPFNGFVYPENNNVSDNITSSGAATQYITYGFRNTIPTPTKSGVSQLDTITCLVNLFISPSLQYTRLYDYAGQIRNQIDGYRAPDPTAGDSSTETIQSCNFVNIETGFLADMGVEGLYFATLEFDIRISKN